MTAAQSTKKPSKPRPNFPLFAASNGQWGKKFQGRKFYFGKWEDPSAAEDRWEKFKAKHTLGLDPIADKNTVVVGDLVDQFLIAKEAKLNAGDLSKRTWQQYQSIAKWLTDHIGAYRPVDGLGPDDFRELRAKFPTTWGTSSTKTQINVIRTIFRWGMDGGFVKTAIRYGDNFSKPSKKRERLERASKPKKMFTAAQIRRLIEDAPAQLKAMIWLAVNCGYGNSDCARLRMSDVQGEWLTVPRGKTGADRKAWLWPETRKAIEDAIQTRPDDLPADVVDLVFVTRRRLPWVSDADRRNNVACEFNKLKKRLDLDTAGVGFYALRHVFETIGGETADQVAVDHIMGHVDDSMAAVYREGVSDARIKKVCQHVRSWMRKGGAK